VSGALKEYEPCRPYRNHAMESAAPADLPGRAFWPCLPVVRSCWQSDSGRHSTRGLEVVLLAGGALVLLSALLSSRELAREAHDPGLATIEQFERRES